MNIQYEKSKIDILEVIQKAGVIVEKTGINSFAKCPFHSEKTASFCINRNKQMFHCFGCGVSGDVIEFVSKFFNFDFKETLKYLNISDDLPTAKMRAGLKRQRHQQKRKQKTARLINQIKNWCDEFYRYCWESVAMIEAGLRVLSYEQLLELSDLIYKKSDYAYWAEILAEAFESNDTETLYEVWIRGRHNEH